jgi:ABC-2 type transport system permease protein
MSRFVAMTKRELMAYFYAPVPYLVMFVFLFVIWFVMREFLGDRVAQADYMPVFQFLTFILLFLIPLLTMNTVAEERTRNTLETLLTAPVGDWEVIASKWLGTFIYYVVMLLPTLVYWFVFQELTRDKTPLDPGTVLTSYLGALLLGGLYIAIGVFCSSLTENGLLSAFLALCTMILMIVLGEAFRNSSSDWLRQTSEFIGQQDHFMPFLQGRIPVYDVLYFALMTVFFLFLAVRAIESRKWR